MDKSFALVWQPIAEAVKMEVSADTFQRWFASVELIRADEERLTLRVPNNIYQLWIETNYLPLLQSAVLGLLGGPRVIKFNIASESIEPANHAPAAQETETKKIGSKAANDMPSSTTNGMN